MGLANYRQGFHINGHTLGIGIVEILPDQACSGRNSGNPIKLTVLAVN